MHAIQVEIRQAQTVDIEQIVQLQKQARRSCVRYGYEDLVRMVTRDYCFIANSGPLLRGFMCATVRQPGVAQIRGVGLINGWRVDTGIAYLLSPLERALLRDGVDYLMHLALENWLAPPLVRQHFATHDYILNYERTVPNEMILPTYRIPGAELRFLSPDEISVLTALDHRAFDWPWHFSSGELVQLMLTTSRLTVLDSEGALVGYACTDVRGSRAQIIRVAVDPNRQGEGFGRYLLADALDFARSENAETVSLNTQWKNTASQRLYQGFGFRAVGRRIPVLIKKMVGP
jgi:ribosomal-protein-alanine N-acetyltransferase